jgi:uncharacterized protein (TIGR03067 family)
MRALLLLTVFAVAAPDRQPVGPVEAPKNPQDLLLGLWSYENRAIGAAPSGKPSPLGIQFLPGETVFMMSGKPSPHDGLTANVVIDWTQNPVAIDFVPKRGGNKMMGILKLEGDHLMLAIRTNGGPRPTDFAGGDMLVGQCRRIKR